MKTTSFNWTKLVSLVRATFSVFADQTALFVAAALCQQALNARKTSCENRDL